MAAWEAIIARHGELPAVRAGGLDLTRPAGDGSGRPVVVVRLDATLIEAVSEKENAEPHRKGARCHRAIRSGAITRSTPSRVEACEACEATIRREYTSTMNAT